MFEEEIEKSIDELKEKFEIIKNKGYIKGMFNQNKGNSGLTFEKLIGKEIDQFQLADYKGIEIKVKNSIRYKQSYLTLFNLVPSNCFGMQLKDLRNKYGKADKDYSEKKVLMNSVFGNFNSKCNHNYSLRLKVNYEEKKIFLCVYDKNNELVEKNIYWDFDDIEKVFENKLKYLAFVKYDQKIINKEKYFQYKEINFYKFKGAETFYNLLEKGIISMYICLGIYKSGLRKGLEHDHGTRFEIKECNLLKLYDKF